MTTTKVRSAVAPARLPLRWLFAGALALLAIPYAGYSQGIVRGAQEAPMRAIVSQARSAAWSAARSEPVSAEPLALSKACLGSRIAAGATAVTAIATGPATTTVTVDCRGRSSRAAPGLDAGFVFGDQYAR